MFPIGSIGNFPLLTGGFCGYNTLRAANPYSRNIRGILIGPLHHISLYQGLEVGRSMSVRILRQALLLPMYKKTQFQHKTRGLCSFLMLHWLVLPFNLPLDTTDRCTPYWFLQSPRCWLAPLMGTLHVLLNTHTAAPILKPLHLIHSFSATPVAPTGRPEVFVGSIRGQSPEACL